MAQQRQTLLEAKQNKCVRLGLSELLLNSFDSLLPLGVRLLLMLRLCDFFSILNKRIKILFGVSLLYYNITAFLNVLWNYEVFPMLIKSVSSVNRVEGEAFRLSKNFFKHVCGQTSSHPR